MADTEEYLEELYAINKESLVKGEDPLELVYVDLRGRIDELKKRIEEFNRKEKKMGMSSLLLKGLYYLAFKLILNWLASDEDSAAVEEALVNAKNEDEVKAVAKRVLIETIDDHFMTETDIPDSVVDGLVKASNTSEVVAVLETETGQKTFFDGLGDLLSGIIGLIFRKK